MGSLTSTKLLIWLFIASASLYAIFIKRKYISFKFQEIVLNIKRRYGGHISLNSEFVNDIESGLHSRNFNIISKNNDDDRAGLDDKSKQEIKNIMENEQVNFDKARLLFTERKFKDNAIGPDGVPLDPKAVTFSR